MPKDCGGFSSLQWSSRIISIGGFGSSQRRHVLSIKITSSVRDVAEKSLWLADGNVESVSMSLMALSLFGVPRVAPYHRMSHARHAGVESGILYADDGKFLEKLNRGKHSPFTNFENPKKDSPPYSGARCLDFGRSGENAVFNHFTPRIPLLSWMQGYGRQTVTETL